MTITGLSDESANEHAMSELQFSNPEQAGIFHLPLGKASALRQRAERWHFVYLSADLSPAASTEAALKILGQACDFPDWYGANFDALLDCLLDSEWKPAPGHILYIEGCARLRQLNPDDFSTLLEVLRAASDCRKEMKQPLWILLDSPARGISSLHGL